mgnify:CR=1 FL=1
MTKRSHHSYWPNHMSTQTAYYSRKTGARVSATFGLRNPTKVVSFTGDPTGVFTDGVYPVVVDSDGMPANLPAAAAVVKALKLAQVVKDAKNAQRRAERAAAKPGATPAKVRKAIANKRPAKQQTIHKSAKTGEIVSAQFAKDNPDTTYATDGARITMVTKDKDIRRKSVARLKDMRDSLPPSLIRGSGKVAKKAKK